MKKHRKQQVFLAVTILTKTELEAAKKIYNDVGIKGFAKSCSEQIITPVIDRINQQLGQENNPLYLAYAVEFLFLKGGKDAY